jgi:hypothetical protein
MEEINKKLHAYRETQGLPEHKPLVHREECPCLKRSSSLFFKAAGSNSSNELKKHKKAHIKWA